MRQIKKSNIDRVLAAYDRMHQSITHVCIPLHSVNHFVLLDVTLRNADNKNGYVSFYDYHQDIHTQKFNVSRMWWAKYFGIYGQDKDPINRGDVYLGTKDMCVEKFVADEQKPDLSFSTLDHGDPKDDKKVFQTDGYNCGIWTLMTMIKRSTGCNGYLLKQLNEQELDDCRVRIFNTIYKVFKVICPTNNFIYNWKEGGATKGEIYWRTNFIEVPTKVTITRLVGIS